MLINRQQTDGSIASASLSWHRELRPSPGPSAIPTCICPLRTQSRSRRRPGSTDKRQPYPPGPTSSAATCPRQPIPIATPPRSPPPPPPCIRSCRILTLTGGALNKNTEPGGRASVWGSPQTRHGLPCSLHHRQSLGVEELAENASVTILVVEI